MWLTDPPNRLAKSIYIIFFFNDTATTEIYTLSLHDALPICLGEGTVGDSACPAHRSAGGGLRDAVGVQLARPDGLDRKSTRLNSSHTVISYAVFCLKKIVYVLGEHPI